MDFRFLYDVIQLKGNVNTEYFDEADGGYKCKPILIKTIADDAVAYFKDLILELDTGGEFTAETTLSEEDKVATSNEKAKYKAEKATFDKRWEDYKAEHFKEEFEVVAIVNDELKKEAHRILKGFSPELSNYDLRSLMEAYKAALELSEKYSKNSKAEEQTPEYNSLPRDKTQVVSKDEFKSQHNAMKKMWREELGLPTDAEMTIKIQVPGRKLLSKSNEALKNVEPDDTGLFKEFAEQMMDSLNE